MFSYENLSGKYYTFQDNAVPAVEYLLNLKSTKSPSETNEQLKEKFSTLLKLYKEGAPSASFKAHLADCILECEKKSKALALEFEDFRLHNPGLDNPALREKQAQMSSLHAVLSNLQNPENMQEGIYVQNVMDFVTKLNKNEARRAIKQHIQQKANEIATNMQQLTRVFSAAVSDFRSSKFQATLKAGEKTTLQELLDRMNEFNTITQSFIAGLRAEKPKILDAFEYLRQSSSIINSFVGQVGQFARDYQQEHSKPCEPANSLFKKLKAWFQKKFYSPPPAFQAAMTKVEGNLNKIRGKLEREAARLAPEPTPKKPIVHARKRLN